jgi:hypothetical protein
MNTLERTLIEKTGADNGWECVMESRPEVVRLASGRHPVSVEIIDRGSLPERYELRFSEPVESAELKRDLPPELFLNGMIVAYNDQILGVILRRYAELVVSLPTRPLVEYEKEVAEILESEIGIRGTETERLVRQRVGQDVYRKSLMHYWKGQCAVTGIDIPEVLRASHAKPWADCDSDADRLNVYNGFLLSAELDALFDAGLVTFDMTGLLHVSNRLTSYQKKILHLDEPLRLRWIDRNHFPFLEWHTAHVFQRI